MADLQTFVGGPFATNGYLYKDVLIDAPQGIAAEIGNVKRVLLTHTHWDHIIDAAKIDAPLYCHAEDAENMRSPGSDRVPLLLAIEGREPDGLFSDGEMVAGLRVIHTPGHSPGGVCFYDEKEGILFSGDTLFAGSIGNLSLATAEPERMWRSLERLAQLPPETLVYPGHGEPTRIGNETWLSRAKEIFGG